MPISKQFKSVHEKTWEIYFSQCYSDGSLKFPQLADLLQLTASEHADNGGLGFKDLADYNQTWVLHSMRIEISKMPRWSDFIQVKTWIQQLKGFKSLRNFTVERNGEVLIQVSSLWALFNMKSRRPDTLKIDISHVKLFPNKTAIQGVHEKIDLNFQAEHVYEKLVQFSHLDIVNHVNNIKYLEWCLNYVDPTIILENKVKAIDLNFIKELNLDDKFSIHKATSEDKIFFKILKGDKICFTCIIEIIK